MRKARKAKRAKKESRHRAPGILKTSPRVGGALTKATKAVDGTTSLSQLRARTLAEYGRCSGQALRLYYNII